MLINYRISGNFRVAKFLRISRIRANSKIFFREISQCGSGLSSKQRDRQNGFIEPIFEARGEAGKPVFTWSYWSTVRCNSVSNNRSSKQSSKACFRRRIDGVLDNATAYGLCTFPGYLEQLSISCKLHVGFQKSLLTWKPRILSRCFIPTITIYREAICQNFFHKISVNCLFVKI